MREDFEGKNKNENCSSVIVLNTNAKKKRFDKHKNKYFLRAKSRFKVHAVVTNVQSTGTILFFWI